MERVRTYYRVLIPRVRARERTCLHARKSRLEIAGSIKGGRNARVHPRAMRKPTFPPRSRALGEVVIRPPSVWNLGEEGNKDRSAQCWLGAAGAWGGLWLAFGRRRGDTGRHFRTSVREDKETSTSRDKVAARQRRSRLGRIGVQPETSTTPLGAGRVRVLSRRVSREGFGFLYTRFPSCARMGVYTGAVRTLAPCVVEPPFRFGFAPAPKTDVYVCMHDEIPA